MLYDIEQNILNNWLPKPPSSMIDAVELGTIKWVISDKLVPPILILLYIL